MLRGRNVRCPREGPVSSLSRFQPGSQGSGDTRSRPRFPADVRALLCFYVLGLFDRQTKLRDGLNAAWSFVTYGGGLLGAAVATAEVCIAMLMFCSFFAAAKGSVPNTQICCKY